MQVAKVNIAIEMVPEERSSLLRLLRHERMAINRERLRMKRMSRLHQNQSLPARTQSVDLTQTADDDTRQNIRMERNRGTAGSDQPSTSRREPGGTVQRHDGPGLDTPAEEDSQVTEESDDSEDAMDGIIEIVEIVDCKKSQKEMEEYEKATNTP